MRPVTACRGNLSTFNVLCLLYNYLPSPNSQHDPHLELLGTPLEHIGLHALPAELEDAHSP